MIPTPRTDAFFRPDAQEYPAAKFARKLERQNTELLEALELFIEPGDSEKLRIARAAIAKAKSSQ